ncbi:MAG: sulfotransferase family protein [Pseudomonadota bacterium]
MALQVIGCGFGRTGTDSMRKALNRLGVGPTHHMYELDADGPLRARWLELARGAQADWEALFPGYRACVDWPSAAYWPELIEAFPEARVLLTWRSAESWWASFEKTILRFIKSGEDPGGLTQTLITEQVFGGRPDDRAHAIAVYERNVAAVRETVDPERLLVHGLGDGWGPLCRWLGVEEPDAPYPSGNSAAGFIEKLERDGVDLSGT